MKNLDAFTRAYITAALWSSVDDDGNPLDKEYGQSDIDPETLAKMVADCERFQSEQSDYLISEYHDSEVDNTIDAVAGHDFWLTRNHHGAGFWDGDWVEPIGRHLTDASHKFGECDLYIGDDGKIYC